MLGILFAGIEADHHRFRWDALLDVTGFGAMFASVGAFILVAVALIFLLGCASRMVEMLSKAWAVQRRRGRLAFLRVLDMKI